MKAAYFMTTNVSHKPKRLNALSSAPEHRLPASCGRPTAMQIRDDKEPCFHGAKSRIAIEASRQFSVFRCVTDEHFHKLGVPKQLIARRVGTHRTLVNENHTQ